MRSPRKHSASKGLAEAGCETMSTARQLLAEHVSDLDEDTAIEAKVICELDDAAEGLKG
jgi:hypothetical protein